MSKTNSLLITRWSFSDPCPGIPANVTAIHRLDLSPDGTQVLAESCFWFDANPADWDGETRGLSIGPNSDPILVIGNGGSGSGNQEGIATIDLATNTASGFATTNFFAQHRIVGGTYSRVLGKALVHDSFQDALRAYSPGEVGGGTLFAPGLSASASSGEKAALIEVSSASYLTGLSATTVSVSLAPGGSQVLTIDVGPAFAGATYVALGSASGRHHLAGSAGPPLGGRVIEIGAEAEPAPDFDAWPRGAFTVRVLDAEGELVRGARLTVRDRLSEAWNAFTRIPSMGSYASYPIPSPPDLRLEGEPVEFSEVQTGWMEFRVEADDGRRWEFMRSVEPEETLELTLSD